MTLLDRYILVRFLVSFITLFALLFLFGVSIDVIINLDEFVGVARDKAGEDTSWIALTWYTATTIVDFQLPRAFQFYAFLYGLIAIGAMGFTLVQMYRHRELVAIMSAGVSLGRLAMPFLLAVVALGVVQLLNHEFVLPRVAPLVLRDHDHIGHDTISEFPVPLTPDAKGAIFHAASFNPADERLTGLDIIERDELGRTTRRITAASATWRRDESGPRWILEDGRALLPPTVGSHDPASRSSVAAIDAYPTDLGPEVLTSRRHGQFMAMLSLRQIAQMLRTEGFADERTTRSLRRHQLGRFAGVVVSVLVMWLALPSFLLREPTGLLQRTIGCAALAIPATIASAIVMSVDLGGISPIVSVALPLVVLAPAALSRWTFLRT